MNKSAYILCMYVSIQCMTIELLWFQSSSNIFIEMNSNAHLNRQLNASELELFMNNITIVKYFIEVDCLNSL